jgi:hypothetical protein
MESVIDLIIAACQLLDIDLCFQVPEVSGELGQAFSVGLAWLMTAVNSHPFGSGCLANLHNPGFLSLDHIVLPLEKISTKSLRCSPSHLTSLAMRTRFPLAASLSFRLNC